MDLTTEQQQVILTGIFGDGCIAKPISATSNCHYNTNCKYKEYIDFKEKLLGDLTNFAIILETVDDTFFSADCGNFFSLKMFKKKEIS